MTVPNLHWFPKPKLSQAAANAYGEVALPFAPQVTLKNGQRVVPQQYLDVVRTLENLEAVLARVSTPEHFQLFAGQEGSVLFLIVAIVGKENYPRSPELAERDKIVYGRRWLIEETTPTSEVVQTALLAIKKVREHELREKVSVLINNGKNVTTPFNNHLDLPLLVGNADALKGKQHESISDQCKRIRIDGSKISLVSEQRLGEQIVVELVLEDKSQHFSDLADKPVVVVVSDSSEFAHALMLALIAISDRTIEENFSFENCARFSRDFDVFKLAEFSYTTRNIQSHDARFDKAFKDMSYKVDASKAPPISANDLGAQQRDFLNNYSDLGGYLPLD